MTRLSAPRRSPEAALHRAVAAYLRVALKPPTIWTSLDAGAGKMSRFAAGDRKARGVQPGWPDILVMHVEENETSGISRALPVVVAIELKAAKGTQSAEQKAVQAAFTGIGASYAIARTVEHVEVVLRQNDVPLHASVIGSTRAGA